MVNDGSAGSVGGRGPDWRPCGGAVMFGDKKKTPNNSGYRFCLGKQRY